MSQPALPKEAQATATVNPTATDFTKTVDQSNTGDFSAALKAHKTSGSKWMVTVQTADTGADSKLAI